MGSCIDKLRMIQCDLCDARYASSGSLYNHKVAKHLGLKSKCLECGKQFTANTTLTNHINNVHKKLKFKCDQCDKKFTYNICKYEGTTKAKLKKHANIKHLGIR